ncbi:MAG: 50S ribosomal protein L3 [Bacilli bacterium]
MKGILGKKVGMTQVFDINDELVPVTVIEVTPNVVLQVKTADADGYEAIQLGYESKREKISTKQEIGHAKKASTAPKRFVREIRCASGEYSLGQELNAEVFEAGEMVDVTGISKGHGFQGVIKRHGQSRGPMAHGSRYHRRPGSMGPMRPMRVLPGKKLPGHMGVKKVTIQNLEVVSIDTAKNVMLVKGSVPGPNNSFVTIKSAVKNPASVTGRELVNYNKPAAKSEEASAE